MATIMITRDDGAFTLDGATERLLTPREVARLFHVDPKTVNQWAKDDKLTCVRTPSGHRRYWENEVHALLRGNREGAPQKASRHSGSPRDALRGPSGHHPSPTFDPRRHL